MRSGGGEVTKFEREANSFRVSFLSTRDMLSEYIYRPDVFVCARSSQLNHRRQGKDQKKGRSTRKIDSTRSYQLTIPSWQQQQQQQQTPSPSPPSTPARRPTDHLASFEIVVLVVPAPRSNVARKSLPVAGVPAVASCAAIWPPGEPAAPPCWANDPLPRPPPSTQKTSLDHHHHSVIRVTVSSMAAEPANSTPRPSRLPLPTSRRR